MLSAPRRLLASSTVRCNLLAPSFVVGSSKDPETHSFSTSAAVDKEGSYKAEKARNLERYEKAKRKQALRAEKQRSEQIKAADQRMRNEGRQDELKQKREFSKALAEGLDPFAENQLEAMYKGLLSAPLSVLGDPALAAPSSLLLEDNSAEKAAGRHGRLAEIQERFKAMELAEQEEKNPGALASRLSARLRLDKEADTRLGDEPRTELAPCATSSPNQLLQTLLRHSRDGTLASSTSTETPRELIDSVPSGLIVESEWQDLLLACAEEENGVDDVQEGLKLMKRTKSNPERVLADVLAFYASQGRTRDALTIAKFAREESLKMSVISHHHLLSTLVPAHVDLALQHLHSLEATGNIPLLDTYTLLIRTLLAPSSPPHLVSRGWDLYAHTRLVAHPVPDVALYSEMIQACSRGPHPSPERALDLFTEMTTDNNLPPSELAYNGVIRACSREGSQERYFEALRLMRQMLDTNVMPSRHTFHAVLEGARRHGDLSRARWILVKMVGVGGSSAPDSNTLGLVFKTYALYQPPTKQQFTPGSVASSPPSVSPAESASSDSPTAASDSGTDPSPPASASPVSETQHSPTDIVQLLGEDSLTYPGPLPQTPDELVAEARNLMLQCVGPQALQPASDVTSSDTPPYTSSMFPAVSPTPFLLNSYLSILASHASLPAFVNFYRSAYALLGVEKNRHTYEPVMEKCETAKNRSEGLLLAREVFAEWQESLRRTNEAEAKDGTEGTDKPRPSGNNISIMWGSMIRTLARSFANDEAVQLLQRFVATYPPANLEAQAVQKISASAQLPALPSPLKLASNLYPETQSTAELDRAPHLLYGDLKLLHLRLANVDDARGIAVLKGIVKAYEGALARSQEVEEERPRMYKRKKAAARVARSAQVKSRRA